MNCKFLNKDILNELYRDKELKNNTFTMEEFNMIPLNENYIKNQQIKKDVEIKKQELYEKEVIIVEK